MSGNKHISVLLLVSFCFLIGHNLVPHQHHLDIPPSPISQTCPIGPQDHHNGDKGTGHCHAFNDIVFEKYNPSGMPDPVRLNTDLVSADPVSVPGPEAGAEFSRLIRQKPPIQSTFASGPSCLRAPPPIV